MTGFEEGMNREVWKRGEEVDCDGGKTMGVGGEIQPQDVSFFFFFLFFLLCFVAPLPVIAAVSLAVGKSAEEWAQVK